MGTTEELDNRLEAFSIQRTLKRGNTAETMTWIDSYAHLAACHHPLNVGGSLNGGG